VINSKELLGALNLVGIIEQAPLASVREEEEFRRTKVF